MENTNKHKKVKLVDEAENIIEALRNDMVTEKLLPYSFAKVRYIVQELELIAEDGSPLISEGEIDALEQYHAEKWARHYYGMLEARNTLYHHPNYLFDQMMMHNRKAGKKLTENQIRLAEDGVKELAEVSAQNQLNHIVAIKGECSDRVHTQVSELLILMEQYELSYDCLKTPEGESVTRAWILEINNDSRW